MNSGGRKHLWMCLTLAAFLPTVLAAQATRTETPCLGDRVTLVSTYDPSQNADAEYRWYRIQGAGDTVLVQESGTSYSLTATRPETYYCEVFIPEMSTTNNLMRNGDFETVPAGVTEGDRSPEPLYFTSTYRFAGWHIKQEILGDDWKNRYVMTKDAKHYHSGFLSIKPHGGKWFALFDASTRGDAWRAETRDNPDLKVVAGEEYVFSYWVANPNNNNNPTARLQFYITYLDANMAPIPIGDVFDLKEIKNQGWKQRTATWTAPYTSDNIAIAVRDLETDSEGNDFCLDDIIFQATATTQQTTLHTDTFHILPDRCCPDVLVLPSRDTVVCSGELPLTWDGLTFEDEGTQTDTLKTADGLCDSICTAYTLSLQVGVEMYGKWEDVIFVPNRDSLFVSYQWYADRQPIPGATDQFYHNPEGLFGEYHCVMQTVAGETQTTCPAAFDELPRSADQNPGDERRQIVARRTYRVGAHLHVIVYTYDDQSCTAEKRWIP